MADINIVQTKSKSCLTHLPALVITISVPCLLNVCQRSSFSSFTVAGGLRGRSDSDSKPLEAIIEVAGL